MQHSATAADHHPPTAVGNGYYQDSSSAHSAPGVVASNGMIGSWASADSQQYQQACNTTDTACSSPLDTPLAKIMQQQQQHAGTSVAGANGVSTGSEPSVATAHPTPPQSAASHGFSNAHNPDAWRAYQNPYHQSIPVPGAYSAAAFASPMTSGMPAGLDSGSFDQSAATADYYYANNGHPHEHPHQLTHSSASGTMPGHQPNGIADMHQLHYHQSQAAGQYHHSQSQQQQHDQDQHQHHHSQQHSQQQQQQHPGLHHHHHDPSSVAQFDHSAVAAVSAAANPHYMGDFGHGMYGGAQEIASAPASVMHLPPIDPTSSLSRHNSYFSMAGSPAGSFDQMSAAAVAAAAAAAASAGPYSPHAAGSGQYMAAARGQQPYPSTMMIGRFNMGGMPSNSTPGAAIPTPPPPSSSVQSQHHQPPPLGSSNVTSMSVPTTPTRPIGMSRMNSHAQSSTTQRKRYLCTVCQKMFARPSTLSTHMHSHTGEKPFECTWDGCGKRFSVMSNLRRHQRIHERQRQKYAKAQQQQHGQMQPADVSDNDSSSGSTTPLVSQMLHSSIATPTSQMHGHHHRHQQHHMPPPPQGFSQPPMLASHVQGGISASLDMHHHGLPSLHHPHPQQHHQHHLMSSVASPPPQHYHHHVLHHPHQQPQQVSLSDPLAKHSVISNSTSEDSATAVMSVKDESLSVANGASTASTNTINPTTPQSSGLKD